VGSLAGRHGLRFSHHHLIPELSGAGTMFWPFWRPASAFRNDRAKPNLPAPEARETLGVVRLFAVGADAALLHGVFDLGLLGDNRGCGVTPIAARAEIDTPAPLAQTQAITPTYTVPGRAPSWACSADPTETLP
jgi:hypothetical protein